MRERCQVAVVGAGPAGAMTALALARLRPGLDIRLVDAAPAPWAKPCGEYLAPPGVAALAGAGLLAAVEAGGAPRLAGLRMAAPGGSWRAPFTALGPLLPPAAFGLGVRRERFDLLLQQEAARLVRLERGRRLAGLGRCGGGWRLDFADGGALACALVVGSDGRLGRVRRLLGLDRGSPRRRCALVARVAGIAGAGGWVEMHCSPLGQVALAPVGDGCCTLNLLLAEDSLPLLRRLPPQRLFAAALRATPTLAARLAGARIGAVAATPPLPQRARAVAADGAVLVGDAAGFVDPFTGEGMSVALRGAQALAAVLAGVDWSRPVDAAALRPWQQAWSRVAGRRHRQGSLLLPLLARRRLAEGVTALLAHLPWAGRLLAAGPAGYAWRPG